MLVSCYGSVTFNLHLYNVQYLWYNTYYSFMIFSLTFGVCSLYSSLSCWSSCLYFFDFSVELVIVSSASVCIIAIELDGSSTRNPVHLNYVVGGLTLFLVENTCMLQNRQK